jgi:isopenicillin-N N-acyltransferase-like protein
MIGAAMRHDRASSYNNVLSSSDGTVVNVEGSATDVEITEPDARGHLVHTNHYVCERMLRYEGDPEYAERSALRFRRGAELLASAPDRSVTKDTLRAMLSDHENAPDSLCRHSEWEEGGDTDTSFWCIADVTDMRITFAVGNPCETTAAVQEFAFA